MHMHNAQDDPFCPVFTQSTPRLNRNTFACSPRVVVHSAMLGTFVAGKGCSTMSRFQIVKNGFEHPNSLADIPQGQVNINMEQYDPPEVYLRSPPTIPKGFVCLVRSKPPSTTHQILDPSRHLRGHPCWGVRDSRRRSPRWQGYRVTNHQSNHHNTTTHWVCLSGSYWCFMSLSHALNLIGTYWYLTFGYFWPYESVFGSPRNDGNVSWQFRGPSTFVNPRGGDDMWHSSHLVRLGSWGGHAWDCSHGPGFRWWEVVTKKNRQQP